MDDIYSTEEEFLLDNPGSWQRLKTMTSLATISLNTETLADMHWKPLERLVRDKEFFKLVRKMVEVHEAKDADYSGDASLSNFYVCETYGIPAWLGCLVRIGDKHSRALSLARNWANPSGKVKDESLDDTLLDMAVYAILCVMLRQRASGSKNDDKHLKVG